MGRGINRVLVSGNAIDDARFLETGGGAKCATFRVVSERHGGKSGEMMTTRVKINVYIEALIAICKTQLVKGAYVIVEGELMTREGARGEVTEVRAREIIFTDLFD